MKRPSFQFYPADWIGNANLQRCTLSEQGAWLRVMCLLHDQDEYGLVRWPLADIATSTGVRARILQTLARKLVLKGHDLALAEPFTFAPFHGGKRGPAIELIPAQPGPIWFSSRMVVDEYKRRIRGQGTRFEATPNPQPMLPIGEAPKPPFVDGASSASSSASSSATTPLPPSTVESHPGNGDPATSKGSGVEIREEQKASDPWPRRIPDETDDKGLEQCARAYGINPLDRRFNSYGALRDACFDARRQVLERHR